VALLEQPESVNVVQMARTFYFPLSATTLAVGS
jgi:hypothetical protein